MVFISYNRDDSEFVLDIGQELKDNGVDIWLDQLDIVPGQDWDTQIENALEDCLVFVVVLSSSSIKSEHVKDELRYSLDEKKRVIPLLIDNCKIPLPLRRKQHVDFRESYDAGFDQLLSAINNKKDQIQKPKTKKTKAKNINQPAKKNQTIDQPKSVPAAANVGFTGKQFGNHPGLSPLPGFQNWERRSKVPIYNYTSDKGWWFLLPIFILVSTGLILLGFYFYELLIMEFNLDILLTRLGSLTNVLVLGIVWGISYAIVGGRDAVGTFDSLSGFKIPFELIFDFYSFGEVVTGMLSAPIINIFFINLLTFGFKLILSQFSIGVDDIIIFSIFNLIAIIRFYSID